MSFADGIFRNPLPVNDPVPVHAPGSPERARLQAELARQSGVVVEIPCVVGGVRHFTGRVVEVSLQIERDADFPIEKYDKVLFHPKNSIPVDFEQNNLLYVVPIEDVVAVFRRHDEAKPQRRGKAGREDDTPE